jgi:hypothetical protein
MRYRRDVTVNSVFAKVRVEILACFHEVAVNRHSSIKN